MNPVTPPRVALLRAEAVGKRYGPRWVLRDAGFEVRRGEILGLIGPNGSGKTTLFGCVAAALPATTGRVLVDGVGLAPDERKRVLFYVPDGIRPWPDQPLGWVLSYVAELFGLDDAARARVVDELDLRALLGARLATLSKGEHKRALLAIGLLSTQPLLLLDEPFDGLDLRQSREVMEVLRAHARTGRTLFLSIHQLQDAERVCERLVLLSAGAVVGEGTLDELRARAGLAAGALEDVFLALT